MTDEDLIDGAIDDFTGGIDIRFKPAARRQLTAKILEALDLAARDARIRREAREAMREEAGKGLTFKGCQAGCKWPQGDGPTQHSEHCDGSAPGRAIRALATDGDATDLTDSLRAQSVHLHGDG